MLVQRLGLGLLLLLFLTLALGTRIPLFVLSRSPAPLSLDMAESFQDFLEMFLASEGRHLVYVQHGVSVGDFSSKVDERTRQTLSTLPLRIDTSIDAQTPVLAGLRASVMLHRFDIADPQAVLKLKQRPDKDARDRIVVNGEATSASINEGLALVASEFEKQDVSVLYVGVASPYMDTGRRVFRTVKPEQEIAATTLDTEQRRTMSRALLDERDPKKKPVWAHSFMTPQWLQVWILLILAGGFVMWGLITSLRIPTPTNVPEPSEPL